MTAPTVPVPNRTQVLTAFAAPGQLIDYWTRGKGAIKIRWGTPGDFDRCVRNLRKYFPKSPEGLCNRLHTRALGVPPGQERAALTDGETFSMGTVAAAPATEADWDAAEAALVPQVHVWSGMLAPIDKVTGDRRRFAPGSLRNRELPLPLMWQEMTADGHANSTVVGRITRIEHRDDGVYAWGDFLDPELFPAAAKAIEQVRARVVGPSVDLDDMSYEYRNADGSPFDEDAHYEAVQRGESPPKPEFVVTDGRVSGATLVAIPAFADLRLDLDTAPDEDGVMQALMASLAQGCVECEEQRALLASAGTATATAPPLAAFADPGLTGPTPFTVTDDGRVYGHVAEWGTCHVGFPGQCVTPPTSASEYAYFHTGEVVTDDGTHVPVGKVVVGTKHANIQAGLAAAAMHYDDTGRVGAWVRAGEDAYGIWVAGVVAPGASAELIAEMRACPLSGDWRRAGTGLEMVAALAVPVPGFPIARTAKPQFAGEAEPFALVAAGTLVSGAPDTVEPVVSDQLVAAVRDRLNLEAQASVILADLERGMLSLLTERREALLAEIGTGKE